MTELPRSTRRVLWLAQGIALCGLALFVGIVLYGIVGVFVGSAGVDASLKEMFLEEPYGGEFSFSMRLLRVAVSLLSDIPGVSALVASVFLFRGYARGEVFTYLSARRLRFIGWMIFLIMPFDIFCRGLGIAAFSAWVRAGHKNLSLSLDDGHIYAAVFGLLIAIVAQVMVQAIAIDEENRSII